MSTVTLVGPVQLLHNGAEQQYMVITIHRDRWVAVESGWKRWGSGMDLKYEYEYNPNFVPDEDEDEFGWKLICGYHSVYRDENEYLEECSIPEEDLLVDGNDILVCPKWAVACLLN